MDVSRMLPAGPSPQTGRLATRPDVAAGVADVMTGGNAPVANPATVTARALAGQSAPVDQERVMAIRLALAEGRYAVDPAALAAAMIARDLP